jgi:hypothetical protein
MNRLTTNRLTEISCFATQKLGVRSYAIRGAHSGDESPHYKPPHYKQARTQVSVSKHTAARRGMYSRNDTMAEYLPQKLVFHIDAFCRFERGGERLIRARRVNRRVG